MLIRILFVTMAMLVSVAAKCQIKDFKFDGFQGAIFPKNEIMTIDDSISIWTPNITETEQVIKTLNAFLKQEYKNGNLDNQGSDNCPVIYKKRKRYYYQIFGTKNEKGDDIIRVNAIWKSTRLKDVYNKHYVGVFDGCSHYWRLDVNLKTGNVINFMVNGIA